MPVKVSAILPAAGRSQRMGRPKLLLSLGERPVIRHCLDALRKAGVNEIVLVTAPPHGALIEEAVAEVSLTLVRNEDPKSDMAGSIRSGLDQVDPSSAGVLIWPADTPLVTAATLRTLTAAFRVAPRRIVIPIFQGRRGHPVLLPRAVAGEIRTLPTLRDVVRRDPARVTEVPVADQGIVMDLDTPEDYRRVLAAWDD